MYTDIIGRPELKIVGEVSSSLEGDRPDWINVPRKSTNVEKESIRAGKILIKGPCDMQQIFAFIKETKNIITEFVYVNSKGISIEQGAHTTHIVESNELSEEDKRYLANNIPFGDMGMFQTELYSDDVQFIVLSMLVDPNLGLYREKHKGAVIAFGEYTNDLTDESIWDDLINGRRFTANCSFNIDNLHRFADSYEYIGRITPEETIANLDYIYQHMSPNAVLILFIGSEMPYECNMQPAYNEREQYHKMLHECINEWMRDKNRVRILDVNQYLTGQQDFTNNIRSY